ncbi:MAG: FG-GAP repeat domain-containing protein [Planctomycetota bacterium]
MLLIKVITVAAVLAGAAFNSTAAEQDPNNDLSQYYGFKEMEIIKLDWGIKGLRYADFNRDGRKDIAIVNNRKSNIELLIQKEEIGPGEKTVVVDPQDVDINIIEPPTRFEKQSVAVSQNIFSFVTGDLNSDKMTDLAFYGEPRGLYVILQKEDEAKEKKSKTLSWRTRKKIKIDDGLTSKDALVCADLNNDGADDLALAARNAVYIITQTKDGSLAEPVKYPTTAQILAIKAGDLNGDKIKDLIIKTSDNEKPINVRFGLKDGQLGPQVQFFIEMPYVWQLHNVDDSPSDEILAIDSRSGRLVCYQFASEKQQDADWPMLFYPLPSGQGSNMRDLAVGDFDGDGLNDVVVSDPGAAELIFYKQDTKQGLTEPVKFPAFADITNLSATDIDLDGKTEIGILSVKEKIIGVSKFDNDRLSFPLPVETTGEPVAMQLADIDDDDTMDCAYISKDANDIRSFRVIYTVAATGQQGEKLTKKQRKRLDIKGEAGETEPAVELKKLAANPDGLRVLDVDQDGLQDVVIFVKYESPILIRQKQKRQFEVVDSPKAQASLIKEAGLNSIAVANVDGKSGEELLIAQKNFARSLVFVDGQRWEIIDQYNAKGTENQISAVAAFALETKKMSDQPAIFLLDGQNGQLQILKAGEDKTYRFEKQLDVSKWNTVTHLKMAYAQLTGQKVNSILLFDSEKFALITPPTKTDMPETIEQKFTYETKIKDGVYGNLTAGDINSDDLMDIIMVEYKRNHIEILALDSDAKPVPAMRFKLFEEKSYRDKKTSKSTVEPRELKVADVTGDGKEDLITIIHDRIIIYPQD